MAATRFSLYRSILTGVLATAAIAGGIVLGFIVAPKLGLTQAAPPITPSLLQNESALEISEFFPELAVVDRDSREFSLSAHLDGQKTVVAFVTATCYPCLLTVDLFLESDAVRKGDYQAVLITPEPALFTPQPGIRILAADSTALLQYGIEKYPTVVGVGSDRRIRFVSSGYTDILSDRFFLQNL